MVPKTQITAPNTPMMMMAARIEMSEKSLRSCEFMAREYFGVPMAAQVLSLPYLKKALMIIHNMQRIISGETVFKIGPIGHPFALISEILEETLIGQLIGSRLKDRQRVNGKDGTI
jgi:hypothetical protein